MIWVPFCTISFLEVLFTLFDFFQKAVIMATMTLIEEAKFSKTIDILVIYSGVLGVAHVQYHTPVCDRLHGIHFLSSKFVDL